MLLDFVNIKVLLPNGRLGLARYCKATTSNKVNWIMSMGISFSEALINMLHTQSRGKNPNSKKLINIDTGEVFECISDVAKLLKIKKTTLSAQLTGQNKNNTKFKYYA